MYNVKKYKIQKYNLQKHNIQKYNIQSIIYKCTIYKNPDLQNKKKMNFKENYILENEVVRLEPLTEKNFDDLVHFSIHEPEIWEFNANAPNNPENLKRYINFALAQKEKSLEYPFVVYDKKSQKFIGMTRFYNISEQFKTLEIGFTWYGKNKVFSIRRYFTIL